MDFGGRVGCAGAAGVFVTVLVTELDLGAIPKTEVVVSKGEGSCIC